MSAAIWNGLVIEEGCRFYLPITYFTDPDCITPVDITSWGARFSVREDHDKPVLYLADTDNGRVTIPTGTDGRFEILIDGTVTAYRRAWFKKAIWEFIAWPNTASPTVGVIAIARGKLRYERENAAKG